MFPDKCLLLQEFPHLSQVYLFILGSSYSIYYIFLLLVEVILYDLTSFCENSLIQSISSPKYSAGAKTLRFYINFSIERSRLIILIFTNVSTSETIVLCLSFRIGYFPRSCCIAHGRLEHEYHHQSCCRYSSGGNVQCSYSDM